MTVLGIDLGTTYSTCAVFKEEAPLIIPNNLGEKLTPSVVGAKDGIILVGSAAQELIGTKNSQVISSFKRYMGTSRKFNLLKKQFTPEELSALILKKLKEDAEIYLQESITEAIISVPAYFNHKQRTATKIAGELAGLKVERLINEPTAAALQYGLVNLNQESKYLIFDIGGGTFDVSIVELFNGVLEVRATAGDNHLGGDDFTNVLANHIIVKSSLVLNQLTEQEFLYFWKQAEFLKKLLYKKDQAELNLEFKDQIINIQITRTEIEGLYAPLLNKIINPIRRALNDANLSTSNLDAILLVGGSTKLHVIPKICAQIFKKIAFSFDDPQLVVAMGAAVQAGLKTQNFVLKELVLTDVSAYSLGVSSLIEGHNEIEYCPIIERNCILPTSKVKKFYTITKNQKKIVIDIYQGESRKVENNIFIGSITIPLPPNSPEKTTIDIRFTYNINGILEVQVNIPDFNIVKTELFRESCGNLTDEEIKNSIENLKELKIHPRELEHNTVILLKAERLYEETLGDTRELIASMIRKFQEVLDSQNIQLIDEYRLKFADFLHSVDKLHEYEQ